MSNLLDKAVEDAIRNLNAAGCKYAILKADGTTIDGGLDVKPAKPPKKERTRTVRHDFRATGYMAKIHESVVGEVVRLEKNDYPVEAFRSTVSAYLVNHFGRGNSMTTVADGQVEFLRLK